MLKCIIQCAIKSDAILRNLENKGAFVVRNKSSLVAIQHYYTRPNVSQHSVGLGILFASRLCSSHNLDFNKINEKESSHRPTTTTTEQMDLCTMSAKYDSQEIEEGEYQEDNPDMFESVNFKEITGDDEELLNLFKLLLLEVDVLRQDGQKIPKKMSTDQWKELFALKSRYQRLKFLKFLWLNEMKKLSSIKKKELKKTILLEKLAQKKKENETEDHIRYGFGGSTIFLRIYDSTMNLYDNGKLVQAMQFGQNIVIDCAYDTNMSPMENKLCAKQLSYMFAENRLDREPFNLHFCNMNRDSILFKSLKKHIPTLDDPEFPFNLTEDNYLDLFPKEKLVYLTPHCRTELQKFDYEDIYIVGALVDKQNNQPLSLAKAKREGIRMAQLPLDRYLEWNQGTKSLTINQVLKILLDFKTTGDWNTALKNVPTRKIRQPGQPVKDLRKFYRRGTTFTPPNYIKNKDKFY